ncbi:BTB/POZ domain-containing adapter for CUL3-mediated RhoA degradation protein 1 [Arapaima gigas]
MFWNTDITSIQGSGALVSGLGPSPRTHLHHTRPMSAEASAGTVVCEPLPIMAAAAPPSAVSENKGDGGLAGSKYVKLNVGGSLHYTTVQTLSKEDSLLHRMCTGAAPVTTDSEGWVVLDRSGRHFGLVLNFLRDGYVPLPESQRELEEVLAEAQYYRVQGLVQHCLAALKKLRDGFEGSCRIPMITSPKEEQRMITSCRKPVVKLQNNRGNNKYSYTSNSDDNLLKNIELFDKLGLRFNGRVLFVKDVLGDEICCWSFYGEGRKIAEVCCTSIVYATEKKQTKVEFPEARIFEETLNILIYENGRGSGPSGLALLESGGAGSSPGAGQSEEDAAGVGGGDRRVRRIHVRRHIMHDERGHGLQTVYKD